MRKSSAFPHITRYLYIHDLREKSSSGYICIILSSNVDPNLPSVSVCAHSTREYSDSVCLYLTVSGCSVKCLIRGLVCTRRKSVRKNFAFFFGSRLICLVCVDRQIYGYRNNNFGRKNREQHIVPINIFF